MKSQGREHSWRDPNLPDKKKVRDVPFYEEFVCTQESKKVTQMQAEGKSEVKHT